METRGAWRFHGGLDLNSRKGEKNFGISGRKCGMARKLAGLNETVRHWAVPTKIRKCALVVPTGTTEKRRVVWPSLFVSR